MALWWSLRWSTMVAAFLSCWGSRWIRDMLVICWLTRSTTGWFSTLFVGLGGFTWVPLMDAVLVRRVQVLCLASGVNAEFLHYGNPWFDYVEMIEACSGLGGVSHGALAAGIHTTVATDSTGRMPDLHPVHVDCEHVTGDIGDLLVVAKAAMLGSQCVCRYACRKWCWVVVELPVLALNPGRLTGWKSCRLTWSVGFLVFALNSCTERKLTLQLLALLGLLTGVDGGSPLSRLRQSKKLWVLIHLLRYKVTGLRTLWGPFLLALTDRDSAKLWDRPTGKVNLYNLQPLNLDVVQYGWSKR